MIRTDFIVNTYKTSLPLSHVRYKDKIDIDAIHRECRAKKIHETRSKKHRQTK